MAWFAVYFLSKHREGAIGLRVCFLLYGVASELREKRAFGNKARCFEWAAVGD
jgi:hypothetical protein